MRHQVLNINYEFAVLMKICYIGGANSIHLQRWVKWIANKNHEVHLITDYPTEINNVTIYPLAHHEKGGLLNFYSKMRQTKQYIHEIKPDLIHAHYAFGYGTFAAYANFHPYVLTAWGSDILVDTSTFFGKTTVQYALKKSDLITCDAYHLKESMKKLGVDDQKITIVYFGTDTKKFTPQKKDPSIREKLHLKNESVVISLRNLEPLYNIESLITAIPKVLKEIPEATFIIGGKGSQEMMLKQMVISLKIDENVRFTGPIPNDVLPYYLTASDAYVSTSLSDAGLSASTAEAMACEVPVISTNFGENTEWVKDNENGFTIPLKDPDALAEKILILLKDKSLREKLGKKGRQIIKERLDYDTEMSKMERLYEELIQKK